MKEIVIDGSAVRSVEDFHALLKEELALPHWYGNNLDALFDVLTDFHEEVSLTLLRSEALCQTLGSIYPRLVRMLSDAAEENPLFTFHLA